MVKQVASRLFRSIFREQKVRLQVEWLTHTDELIMEELSPDRVASPDELADELERSEEYVADRCRQLALNGLLERIEEPNAVRYRLAEFGERYLAGDVDADELKLEDEDEEDEG